MHYALLPEASARRSSVSSSSDEASPRPSQPQPRLAPLPLAPSPSAPPSVTPPLLEPLPSFPLPSSPLSALLPPSPLFLLTTTEARGSVHLHIQSLRVHPGSLVSSLTFRMVCLHAPLLLRPSLQLKLHARMVTARREAALLAEALWLEEEKEGRGEEEVRLAGGPSAVGEAVRRRAKVAVRHRRWRSEARRSGRVVELSRAMLQAGLVEQGERLRAVLSHIDAPDPLSATAAREGQGTGIGDIEQKKRRTAGTEDGAAAAGSAKAHRVDTSVDVESLMEEALYSCRHLPLSQLKEAVEALPPPTEPAISLSAASTSATPPSSSASVLPLSSPAAVPPSPTPPSASASSGSPYSTVVNGGEAYVSFTPRAWCDGAYLRSSLSLASSHLSHHSTVYLMFECPHPSARAHHRESVYAAGPDRRGFAVFVRHAQSRSLLRVVVHLTTRVWRVKAVAARHCFDWDEEGLRRLDEELRRRKAGELDGPAALGAAATFDLTGDDYGEEEEAAAAAAARVPSCPTDRCALLHYGRVCFDDDSLTFSGIGPGDVLTLLDKQSPLDQSIDRSRYSSSHWYPDRLCKHLVHRSTVFDVHAMLVQLRECVDEVVYRPLHLHRLKEAFKRLDPHHSGQLNEQEVAFSTHTILRLLQRRVAAAADAQRSRLWLVPMEGQSGASQLGEDSVGFEEPSCLPTDQATSFPHFLRLLSDGLVELMRARQFDLIHPAQPFVKPSWWLQDHLSADNHRLLHTVLSTLPDLALHRDEAVKADGEWTLAHLQTFLGRVGLSSAHSAAATAAAAEAHASGGAERERLEDAYILSQVLKAEQERQLVERETHHIHRGFTFSARRRHDAALCSFLHHLDQCLTEDFELDEATQAPQHLVSYVRTGALTVVQFLLRPLLLFVDLSGQLWQQREASRDGWLAWLWSMSLLSLYISALCGFFYIPFLLVAVYFLYSWTSSASTVSVLECLLPLATTCLLIVYQVNGAVSAELLSLENDEQRMGEAYAESRLLCLEMRASPVLLDYEGQREAQRKADRRERERLEALTAEVDHVLAAASDAGGSGRGMETLFMQGRKQPLQGSGSASAAEQRPSLSVSSNDFGRAQSLHGRLQTTAAPTAELPPPTPQASNAIGASKGRRLQMSHTLLHWRLGPEKSQGDLLLWHKLLFLLLSIARTVVPGLYRVRSGSPFFGSTWSDQFVSGGQWVCIPAVYLFLTNLGRACMGYHQLAVRLQSVTLVADAAAAFESKLPFFVDLRQPNNLEYWLALRETAKQVDLQLLGMVAGAVMMVGLLLVIAVVRVLFYHEGLDLFSAVSITDISLYSLFIFTFLLIVVQANTVLSVEHLQLIQRIRHQLSLDVCNGAEWHGLTVALDEEERRPLDSWSELDTFEAEEEEERLQEEEARRMREDVQGGDTGRRHRLASPPSAPSPLGSRRSSGRAAALPLLCPHQLVPFECMTCALQSHTSGLHARQSARLQSVHSLLSSLHSHSVRHSSHDRVSYGYYRFEVGAQLLDSTINHLTFLDEPVRLLGLVVNQQLLMQAAAAIVTGGASALSSLVPSSSS